jgi:hypothetical protein
MSVVSVAEASSSWSVEASAAWEEAIEAWDEDRALLAATRCKGGRGVLGEGLVGVEEAAAVSMRALGVVDEGFGDWVISA